MRRRAGFAMRVAGIALGAALIAVFAATPGALGQAASPAGVRVVNSDIHDPAGADLGGAPAISLAMTRNGACSGKVVVSSDAPIAGLKATVGDLRQGDATIPASETAVRYGVPWELTIGGWYRPKGADILLEAPPAELPAGAVDVWVTVRVPKAARPGKYAGELVIELAAGGPFKAPVTLDVQNWTLPDTQDWRTWIELLQSPDNLAAEYDLPLWSDRHWEMIGKSLRLMGQVGSRVVYIPLICNTNFGNAESMVRWVTKGDDKYEYDFTVMDKYLDTAEANLGRPKLVIFYVWDVFMNPPKEEFMTKIRAGDGRELKQFEARLAHKGMGPPVTVVHSATGKTETVFLPPYESPEGKAQWAPLWAAIRSRMQKRGLDKIMQLGVVSDWRPSEEQVTALYEITAGLPWTTCTHHTDWLPAQVSSGKGALYGKGMVGYVAAALEFEVTINPAKERTYGWKNPIFFAQFWRMQFWNYRSLSTVRHEAECNITGMQRGLGHIGADFWYSIKDKKGKRVGNVQDRYPQSYWHSLNVQSWLLAPGPGGPVGTARLELMREGVQECEARIFIENALTDATLRARLGDELATRAQAFLDDQQRNLWRAKGAPEADFEKYGHVTSYKTYEYDIAPKWKEADGNAWFIQSGWAARVARLYALADEVATKLAAK